MKLKYWFFVWWNKKILIDEIENFSLKNKKILIRNKQLIHLKIKVLYQFIII